MADNVPRAVTGLGDLAEILLSRPLIGSEVRGRTSGTGVSAPGPTVAAMKSLLSCSAQEDLSQQELDLLEGLPEGANKINFTMVACELQAAHPGPHLALGQIYEPDPL